VAHELRTPLATIKGYLQITRDGLIEPDDRILESLHQEADLLSRLVDDLQDLSLADAGELKIERKEIALQDVINQVVDTFARGKAEDKNIELKTDIQETPLVEADTQRIDQVVRNLLDNAISYTPGGGTVRISLEKGDRCVRVTVKDDGIGIPKGEKDRVFDRFYRVDKSRTRKTGGSGLGLTVASRIVRAHGGEIGLETGEGQGSKFWFTLPL
jgi:signal transduction histidine kinase